MEDYNEQNANAQHIISDNPKDRILARQLRINRRLEASKKKKQHEGEEIPEDIKKSPLDVQVDKSEDELKALLGNGSEQVTNVHIASDAREVLRRALEQEASVKRSERLQQDAEDCSDKLEEINKRWDDILQSIDPLDLHSEIERQKELCDEVLKLKNNLIEELRGELELSDDKFEKIQKSQKEDLKLLIERIDTHCKLMKNAYRKELNVIETVIEFERRELVKEGCRKWETAYKERDKLETENIKMKTGMIESFEDEMNVIHMEHYEEYRKAKIQLEKDIQLLQLELQRVKALCLWNTEKLEYNYQVLKKRDEENILIKSQQKRKINKLQDIVNDLKKKITETKNNNKMETENLTKNMKRLHMNILDTKRKAQHFSGVNDKKYHDLWEMNKETANEMLDKILAADKIIHEQQLGIEWKPPDLTLLEKADLPSYRSAQQVIEEICKEKDFEEDFEEVIPDMPEISKKTEDRLLRHILQNLADSSGFLIDKKLKDLLVPYTEPEQTLIKIDNVFSALGIKNEEDMNILKSHFIPYCYCIVCSIETEVVAELLHLHPGAKSADQTTTDTQLHASDSALSRSSSRQQDTTRTLSEHDSHGKDIDDDSSSSFPCDDPKYTLKSIQEKACKPLVKGKKLCLTQNHVLHIEQIYVLKALRDFVTKFNEERYRPKKDKEAEYEKRYTMSRFLLDEEVVHYWNRFLDIFPSEHEKLWDGLFLGLQKYHKILEERHKLNKDTETLRSQNAELRKLLHTYLSSKKPDAPDTATDLPKSNYVPGRRSTLSLQNLSFCQR